MPPCCARRGASGGRCAGARRRLESFLTDTHARDGLLEGELALDADGKFLGLRARTYVGHRRLCHRRTRRSSRPRNTKNCLSSVYAIPAIHFGGKMVLTNTAPLGPYRGAGRPEAIYLVERLIDGAARAMGIDRAELRRRNLIPPSAMPYRTPIGPIYDSGDFAAILEQGAGACRLEGFPARRAASERAAASCAASASAASSRWPAASSTRPSTCASRRTAGWRCAPARRRWGRGICRPSCRWSRERLGVDPGAVRLVEGDSDEVPAGTPSVASRSIMMAGSATALACDQAIEKGRRGAAHLFQADPGGIEFSDGVFRVAGTDRAMPLLELAQRMRAPANAGGARRRARHGRASSSRRR